MGARRPSRRGATIVEFALAWTIFFLVTVVGIMDLGRGIWAYNVMAHAAQEATRYAMVHGSESLTPATAADIADFVQKRTFFLGSSAVTVSTTWEPDNEPGSVVLVQVQYDFNPLLGVLLGPTITVGSTSRMTVAN